MFGPDLHHVRKELRAHNHDVIHNGVKVFVRASQYEETMDAFWRFREERSVKIMASHIIVSHTWLPSLNSCLETLPTRYRGRVKKHGRIYLTACRKSPRSGSASSSQNNFSENPQESHGQSSILRGMSLLTINPSKEECGVESDGVVTPLWCGVDD